MIELCMIIRNIYRPKKKSLFLYIFFYFLQKTKFFVVVLPYVSYYTAAFASYVTAQHYDRLTGNNTRFRKCSFKRILEEGLNEGCRVGDPG